MHSVLPAALVAALLVASQSARAEEAAVGESLASTVLFLRDGRTLRGEVLDRDETSITLRDARTGEVTRIEEALVRRAGGTRLPPRCATADGLPVTLTLEGDRVVEGRLTRRCEGSAQVTTADGSVVTVADREVRAVRRDRATLGPPDALPEAPRPPEGPWFPSPMVGRALASPTALLPDAGEVVASSRQLSVGAEVGILGFAELGLETTLPVMYASGFAPAALLRASAGRRVGPVALRGGAVASLHGGGLASAFLFGAATLGDADRFVSAYAGPPLPGAAMAGGFQDIGGSVTAAWRFHLRLAAVTEHWVGDSTRGIATAHAAGLRLMSGRSAADLGAVYLPRTGQVLPWVGLTWRVAEGRAP